MKLYYFLMELLFPPKCVLCGKLLKEEELDLCRDCRMEVPRYGEGKSNLQFLDSFAAVWYYEKNVRKSILRYKFHGARSNARSYGRMLAMLLLEQERSFELLTWVPVSPLRKFFRGYDQGELLAQAVGAELGVVPVPLLRKIRHNRPQSGISDAAKRKANVLGAYRLVPSAEVSGKRILLLDDILTTGATAGECARMLKTAGTKEVHCAAIAAARK